MLVALLSGRHALLSVATIVALVAVACSSTEEGTPATVQSELKATAATSTPLPQITPTPRPQLSAEDRRAVALMTRLYDFERGPDLKVIDKMVELDHAGLVAPLVEITGFSFSAHTAAPIGRALLELTGEDLGGGFESQTDWFKWLADHPEFEPIAGYDKWKGDFYSEIAVGLDSFLYEGVPSTIPLWGVQFGGVGKDGIPALDNPVFIGPDEADYLDPNERVLGIVVNGEARAYPERIMRVHELSNDVVGGRPIVLVY